MRTPHRHLSVDELSHRASTGLAIRKGNIKISDPIPSSYVHNGAEMDGAYEQPTPRIGNTGTWSGGIAPVASHSRSGSTPLVSQSVHASKFTERTSLGPSLSASNMSSTPSKDTAIPRRDGGLRASLKRMFSKKASAATIQKRNTHQSDLIRSPPVMEVQREAPYDLPTVHRHDLTPGRPLNSHATHANHDIENAVEVVEHAPQDQPERRRNTLPDFSGETALTPAELRQCHFSATRERPATPKPDTNTRRDILHSQLLKRRSKSADALADLLLSPCYTASDRRDRSEEIAYWRNSVIMDPLPQMPAIESTTSLSTTRSEQLRKHASSQQQRPSIEPAQDFDFGLNSSTHPVRPSTLQERVNTLEVKLFDFEYALAKLQGNDLEKPALPRKHSRQKSQHDSYPNSGDSSSSTNGASSFSSPRERWQPSSPPPQVRSQSRIDRTSKATTIKPVHGRRPSSRSHISNTSIHITHSQYDALRNLIENEKNARQRLEVQVVNLQNEIDSFKTPVHAYNGPMLYPTPSPDSCHHVGVSASKPVRSPVQHSGKDINETSRFSMSETDPETENDIENGVNDDEPSPDMYRTPQESNFQFEPRTLSPVGMF